MKVNKISAENNQNFGMAKLDSTARIMAINTLYNAKSAEKLSIEKSLKTISNNFIDHFIHTYKLGNRILFEVSETSNKILNFYTAPAVKITFNKNRTNTIEMFEKLASLMEKKAQSSKIRKAIDSVDKIFKN